MGHRPRGDMPGQRRIQAQHKGGGLKNDETLSEDAPCAALGVKCIETLCALLELAAEVLENSAACDTFGRGASRRMGSPFLSSSAAFLRTKSITSSPRRISTIRLEIMPTTMSLIIDCIVPGTALPPVPTGRSSTRSGVMLFPRPFNAPALTGWSDSTMILESTST